MSLSSINRHASFSVVKNLIYSKYKLQPLYLSKLVTSHCLKQTSSIPGHRTKEPLYEGERAQWKGGLKTQHSKKLRSQHLIHFMANRWGKCRSSDRFYFLGLQDHCWWDCSHELRRHLLLGRKAMTNPDSKLKRKDITLPTKVCIVKAVVFW